MTDQKPAEIPTRELQGRPDVAVGRRTQGDPSDPTAPAGASSGTAVIRHTGHGGITTVPRSAFDGSYRFLGWEEVDTEAERDSLYAQALDLGVNVPETATGREIVESMAAFAASNREV